MNKSRIFIGLISVTALLLVGTIVFGLLRDYDPYRYFTGMGSSFDLSPDEEHYFFSYYLDGKESIYRSNQDGSELKQLTESDSERHHQPRSSVDGTKILFLAKNPERINTLYLVNQDGSEQKRLTSDKMHVSEAVFSVTSEEIYFVGIAAEDFNKAEGETSEGFDLFVVNLDSGKIEQVTDKDYFNMNFLSLSPDGKEIYYSRFDGSRERVIAYSLEDGLEKDAPGANKLPKDTYSFTYSQDGSKIAYTTVSEESRNSSLFEYELYLFDLQSGQTTKLTTLGSSVVSPLFFKEQNQIAFLENTNWPADPADHELKVVTLESGAIQSIEIDLSGPAPEFARLLMKSIDTFANGNTVAVLYVVLLGLITTYLAFYHSKRKSYLPGIASLILAALVFISSFVVAIVVDPWYGIGLGMLAASLVGCTVVVFGYAFILNFFEKRD